MEKEVKQFVKASLIYLALGVLFGMHMGFADHAQNEIRFIHLHLLLLGFMAMMIYGVSYHILPRFNARPIPYPSWVNIHFWSANVGLWGMCIFYALGAFWTTGALRMAFGLFCGVEVFAIFLFVINVYSVMRDEPEEEEPAVSSDEPAVSEEPEVKPVERIRIDPDMKIAEILDSHPQLEETLNELGFGNLTSPAVRQSAARMISLKMACTSGNKNLGETMAALEGGKLVKTDDEPPVKAPAHADHYLKTGGDIKRGDMATVKTQIGALLEVYPETKVVFAKNYGEACFTCPGQKTETVEQTAMMHNAPPERILGEINDIITATIKNQE